MDRQSFVLVGENFHGFIVCFNFKVYSVKIHFFPKCSKLESIISEKTHLLEKYRKTDIGKMETVSVVREYKKFYGSKRLSCFMFAIFMFNMLLYFAEMFEKMDKNREKKAGIKKIQ